MALIKCAECGNDVSENASTCPNCGNPIRSDQAGFVAVTEAGPQEADIKRGTQRAKGRYELGSVIALVGIAGSVVLGIGTGSWLLGIGGLVAALVVGIAIQYS